MNEMGYGVEIIFLRLNSPELAIKRVAHRVKQGGHHVPSEDVRRRFQRGLRNFEKQYRDLADAWILYDNSGDHPSLIQKHP